MSKRIINVLCLHGCCQTKDVFKQILKNYIKLGEKQYNLKFHFIEAKYDHPDNGKTWFEEVLIVNDIGNIKYKPDIIDPVLDEINDVIDMLDIHILMGFSQGGNVVTSLLNYKFNKNLLGAVILSGYGFSKSMVSDDINIPVLGIASESDTIVPFELTPTKVILKHDKGHKIPTKKSFIRHILKFMQTQEFQDI